MGISTFELASWIEGKAPESKYILAGSASPSRSINDLIKLSSDPKTTAANLDIKDLKLNYNSANSGQIALKEGIASLFNIRPSHDDILSTIGASIANHVVLQALLKAGDHVICVQPTYTQLYALPSMLGAEVSGWRHHFSHNWQPDYNELEALIRDNTKMIIVNNPNNPTGTYLDDKLQQQIIKLAQKHNLIILADEVFRPLFHFSTTNTTINTTSTTTLTNGNHHANNTPPKSFLDNAHELNYTNVIVTGSVSKSWSFPGLRLGWIISRSAAIINTCTNLRLYMINSVSPIDELIASEALSSRCQQRIITENLATAQTGIALLEQFVSRSQNAKYKAEWIRPLASSTTLIRFVDKSSGKTLDDGKLCQALFDQVRVLLVPASRCFDMRDHGDDASKPAKASAGDGWMRIGFVADAAYLSESLGHLERFLSDYEEI